MNKKLLWIVILVAVILIIGCVFALQNSGILDQLRGGGIDRLGGTRLVLQIMTGEALDKELMGDRAALVRELKAKGISFLTDIKRESKNISVTSIESARDQDFRYICQALFRTKYALQSTTGQGKVTYVLSLTPDYIRQTSDAKVKRTAEIIQRRLDSLGLRQPVVKQNSETGEVDRLLIELPGVKDSDRIAGLIASVSNLELRFVKSQSGGPYNSMESAVQANGGFLPEGYSVLPYSQEAGKLDYMVVDDQPAITGQDFKTARRSTDMNGNPAVSFFLTTEGGELFARATERNIGQRLAIVLDDKVMSAPVVQGRIQGDGIITGHFTVEEAEDLAIMLRSGALPAPVRVLEQKRIEPPK